MIRYLNFKSIYGTETVDQLDSRDFSFFKEYRKELQRMVKEYRISGVDVYISQRSAKDWIKNDK